MANENGEATSMDEILDHFHAVLDLRASAQDDAEKARAEFVLAATLHHLGHDQAAGLLQAVALLRTADAGLPIPPGAEQRVEELKSEVDLVGLSKVADEFLETLRVHLGR